METVNLLEVARGTVDENGVTFLWVNDPTDMDVLGFDHMQDMINYVMSKMDTFNISVGQTHHKRTFTIWEDPWIDAAGPEGESWTE